MMNEIDRRLKKFLPDRSSKAGVSRGATTILFAVPQRKHRLETRRPSSIPASLPDERGSQAYREPGLRGVLHRLFSCAHAGRGRDADFPGRAGITRRARPIPSGRNLRGHAWRDAR
jgi:hypothetical protein